MPEAPWRMAPAVATMSVSSSGRARMGNRTIYLIVAVVVVLAIAWFGGWLGGSAPEAPPPAAPAAPATGTTQ